MKKDRSKQDNVFDERIIRAEYEAVYRYVLSLSRNTMEAEDIVQETFYKAMKKSDYRGECSIYSWLCSIAKNTWLDKRKKEKREYITDELENVMMDDSESMEALYIDKEQSMEIHVILHMLEEPYKEVFSLRVFGQLSFKDIAMLFGKTESWGRVTYYRAKRMITDKLRKDGFV